MLSAILLCGLFAAPACPAQEVWSVGKGQIALNLSEAKFIRLEQSAKAVFLSNPDIAEIDLQSSRYVYIVGKSLGATTLFILGEDNEQVFSTTLSVGIDAARLTAAAQAAVSGGRVAVRVVEGTIVLSGRVRGPEDAATAGDVVAQLAGPGAVIVNRLELESLSQVNLQVRIAEVSRSISEDLGISLTASSSNGNRSFAAPAADGGGFQISLSNGARNMNLVLDALAQNGLVTILSEPNLTARSGEKATFLAGGRIPYQVQAGDGETAIEMQPVGVELEFTPTVYDEDQIQIQISTRVRDVDTTKSANADAPALSERGATTTIELGSGQSFAIAGMFRKEAAQSLRGFPGLARLPVIGALFRSSKYARGETELVIIVTPYLVRPTEPRNLHTPMEALNPVSGGIEQAITGQLSRPVRAGAPGKSRMRGGFLLQ